MVDRTLKEAMKMHQFENIHEKFRRKILGCEDAASLLGCSLRQFHRLRKRYEEAGLQGLGDKRLGKRCVYRGSEEEIELVKVLYKERYRGFSVKHFHEFLCQKHALRKSYSWTKSILNEAGLVVATKRGGPHRMRRPRKPMRGMMLHQDGSRHEWVPGKIWDLIVTMDDATSEIYSAFFVEEEGTESTFRGIDEVIKNHGLFCALYTDRGSHYFYTPEAGNKVEKGAKTQVGRALNQLNITHIAAYSPQARGRSERMFGTLQKRLPQELALAGITSMEAANQYLRRVYLPTHNKNFMVQPELPDSAFMPMFRFDLQDVLCIQEKRIVTQDNTIRYHNLVLQIRPNVYRHNFVKQMVMVHRYPDGTLKLFHRHSCIGTYDTCGNLILRKIKAQEDKLAA